MGGLIAHERLNEYQEHYAAVLSRVINYSKKRLYSLRDEIKKPLHETRAWYETMARRKYRLTVEKQYLIRNTYEVLNALDDEIIRLIIEIQEEEAVDRAWEAKNLPTRKLSDGIPEHPLAAPYESEDLTVHMNRTWFPVPVRANR